MARQVGRWGGCLLLLFSLTLPITKCDKKKAPAGLEGVVSSSEPIPTAEVMYPADFMSVEDLSGIVVLLAYIWPLLVGLGRLATHNCSSSRLIPFLEVSLCIASGHVIFQLGSLGHRLVGGYVGLAAVATYGLASLADCRAVLRQRRIKGEPNQRLETGGQ